jgi:hypothetical protein
MPLATSKAVWTFRYKPLRGDERFETPYLLDA